jgi:hypothetical protein
MNTPLPAEAGPYCAFYVALEKFARAGDLLSNDAIEAAVENFPSTAREMKLIVAEGRQLSHKEIGERLHRVRKCNPRPRCGDNQRHGAGRQRCNSARGGG